MRVGAEAPERKSVLRCEKNELTIPITNANLCMPMAQVIGILNILEGCSMTVPKSKRSEPKVQFLQDVFRVRKKTLEVLKKFPKGYKFNLPARIAELADHAYWAAYEGNAVFMHKNMPYEDYMHRRQCFMRAYTTLRALTAETSFCYDLVMDGNNFFEDANVRDKTFSEWTKQCAAAVSSMKNIMESDKKRYKEFSRTKEDADDLAKIERAIAKTQQQTRAAVMETVKKLLS